MSESAPEAYKLGTRTIHLLYFLYGLAVVLIFSWFAMPAPKFEGIPGVVCIGYFATLFSIFVSSLYWLARFDPGPTIEGTNRGFVIASLVISILVIAVSVAFFTFAIVFQGMLNML